MDFSKEIFKGKDFSGLLKDIYDNRAKKDEQIKILINELRHLVKNINDATLLVPLLKDYVEVGVKNDENLVKMAAIVQRAMARSTESGEGELILTDEEKEELYDTFKESSKRNNDVKKIKDSFDDIFVGKNDKESTDEEE